MVLAARGQRDLDHGVERISNPEEIARVKRQGRRVWLESIALATALTAGLLLVPL